MSDTDMSFRSYSPTTSDRLSDDTEITWASFSSGQDIQTFSYADAAQGKDISNVNGNRVIEHTHPRTGNTVAIKVRSPIALARTEATMMHHAALNNILAPRVFSCFDIMGGGSDAIARTMVSQRVPGVPLSKVWKNLLPDQQDGIKRQLREQLARMRRCTQPYIGRVGHQPTHNVYDPTQSSTCGPFRSERDFDRWCLTRVPSDEVGTLDRLRWRWRLRQMRSDASLLPSSLCSCGRDKKQFVLTHGDLSPGNIMVKGAQVTGIIDWEMSGFYPEYAEYAFAMALCRDHEKWWLPVLREILEPCEERRLVWTKLVEDDIQS